MISLIPEDRDSFDVLVGMDRLSNRKFGIVCHGKVVRMPLKGDEILRVHGERTQGVTRVSYNLVIFYEEHQCHLLRRGAWSSFEVRVGITEEGEVVTYLRFIAKFSKIVKPLTSLNERNRKYSATPSETSKVENAPAEMLRDLDQQMEKRADDGCTLWIKLYSKYEYETRYHPGKANVVIEALRGKERVKPRRVRAMAMTIQYGVRGMILAAQNDARKVLLTRLDFEYYLASTSDGQKSPVLWAEIGESSLIGPELVQETTDKLEVGDHVLLKVSPWKGVIRFRKKGKLAPRYVGPFEILKRIGPVAYRLRLPKELSSVHDTFHVSNLKKCLADASLHVPLNEINVDKTLRFVEEPVEIMDREIKKLKHSKIALVKVRWNSKRGSEFTWEREDHMKSKYP
ncbi:hypothetical protein Tco_0542821 [Tanacetum coccineum]